MNKFLIWLRVSPYWADTLDQSIILIFIFVFVYLLYWIIKKLIFPNIKKLVLKTSIKWDDILFDDKILNHLSRLLPALIIYALLPIIYKDIHSYIFFLQKICALYIIIQALFLINELLQAIYQISSQYKSFRNRPLKGVLQIFQVVLVFVGIILIIAELTNKSPMKLLTALGASTAILMFVFKDSILGFVSGIQLSANNMMKVGDWITVPNYHADGSVLEITLNTVKIQNFDNTIVTIPPYALISGSFQNWGGMLESKGRRIKRSININMTSVQFCTSEMLERYKKIDFLNEYIEQKGQNKKQTNLGVFRAYLVAYLNHSPLVVKDMIHMVRQLQPTEKGIPIELYFFTSEQEWVEYEEVQANIFDQILAMVQEFDLEIYQYPSGLDLKNKTNENNKKPTSFISNRSNTSNS